MSTMRCLYAVPLVALLAVSGLHAQSTGTVAGVVTDQATQRPLVGAQVTVVGTRLSALTNHEGRFVVTMVPAGAQELRASVIGYGGASQQVNVVAAETVVANFALAHSAIPLEEVIVTATGREERRREVGNSVGAINVAEVELAAVNNMASLIQGRAAGVTVMQSGGTSGSGARVRIRGSNSVSLSNEPLIIVDGVRVNNSAASMSVGTGGQSPSRLNDITPADIETIEILKGPAASALYGTAAANGVIQITTKRGRSGQTLWNVYTELGSIRERNQYHDNVMEEDFCTVLDQAEGFCTMGELHRDNPFHDPELRPFVDGNRTKLGVNVSGGGAAATYYLSAESDREQGIFGINTVDRINVRANVNARLHERLNVAVRSGYLTSESMFPQNDNNVGGITLNGNLGAPRTHWWGDGTGWWFQTPEQVFANETAQEMSRLTGGVNVDYAPLQWLSLVGTAGLDRFQRHDDQFVAPGLLVHSTNAFLGTRTSNRAEVTNFTTTFNATGRFALRPSIMSTTSTGVQYNRDEFHDTRGFGVGVVPGTRSLGGTTSQFAVEENTSENATFGAYLSQQFAFNDRLFITGSVRGDKNSAFGTDIGWVGYPAVSASWVVSEEEFFPISSALSSLRLRSSLGRSGLRPAFRDAATFFDPVPVRAADAERPAITLAGAGNPELKPEISTEFEVGFDAGLLNDRLGLDFTYYNKQSTDALIRRRLAPSIGATTTRFENIGKVTNTGFEALLNARIVNMPRLAWDATLSYGQTKNNLKELGEGVEPIIFGLGSIQRHVEGYPLGGYWDKPLTWTDTNGDGLVQTDEVTEADDFEFLGTPFPTREASFTSAITLYNTVRVSGLLDYRGGHHLYNFTRGDRCAWEWVCEETFNAEAASISDQIGFVGFNRFGRNTAEFVEPADFLKLRELSVTVIVPDHYVRQLRGSGARVTLSGRNLGTWTKYGGYDPEVNTHGQDNFATADYHNQPPVRFYTVRFDVNF